MQVRLYLTTILLLALASAQQTADNANNVAGIGPRKNLVDLDATELTALRDAVARLQLSGEWGKIAADHGVPNAYCPHGMLSFLTWHRRFIARMEIALGVPLPFWDWTHAPASGPGLPLALTEATYITAAGKQAANPLLSGPMPGKLMTVRNINAAFPHDSLLSQESMAMAAESFNDFSNFIEGAHNDVHGAVGGSMNTLDFSAYDPVFWFNHNNVDRIFYRWQVNNKFATYPADARGAMRDSLGTFSGDKMIQDLTGWVRDAPAIMVKTADDTKDVPNGEVQKAGLPLPETVAPGMTASPANPITAAPQVIVAPQGKGAATAPPPSGAKTAVPIVGTAPRNGAGPINGGKPINGNGTVNAKDGQSNSTVPVRATSAPGAVASRPSAPGSLPGAVGSSPGASLAPRSAMPGVVSSPMPTPVSSVQASLAPAIIPGATLRPLNIMEKRFIADDENVAPRALQIALNMEFRLIDQATRTNSELPGYVAGPRVVCVIKDVPSTRDPERIDVFMKDKRIGMVYLFGMGDSGMQHKADRLVDITIPHRDLLDDCDLDQLPAQMGLQQVNEKTGQAVPTPPYTIAYQPMVF